MNLERMQRLLAVLTMPPRRPYVGSDKRKKFEKVKFDMSRWADRCCTAGCACGLYVFNHPEDLLKIEMIDDAVMLRYYDPDDGEAYQDFDAARAFFDLYGMHAIYEREKPFVNYEVDLCDALFKGDYYRTKFRFKSPSCISIAEVRDRVRSVVDLLANSDWPLNTPVLRLKLVNTTGVVVSTPNSDRLHLNHFIELGV